MSISIGTVLLLIVIGFFASLCIGAVITDYLAKRRGGN